MAKILVAEDNEKNRMLFRDILVYHGHEVIEAVNGKEAVEAARTQKPDLILMDVQMPMMNGFDATKILKEDPTTKSIKIIGVTSYAMAGDRERILAAWFDDYISKPIDTRTLPEIVKKHLGGKGEQA